MLAVREIGGYAEGEDDITKDTPPQPAQSITQKFGEPVMWYLALTCHLNLGSGKFGFSGFSVLK